jgi:hypothetical protein
MQQEGLVHSKIDFQFTALPPVFFIYVKNRAAPTYFKSGQHKIGIRTEHTVPLEHSE